MYRTGFEESFALARVKKSRLTVIPFYYNTVTGSELDAVG